MKTKLNKLLAKIKNKFAFISNMKAPAQLLEGFKENITKIELPAVKESDNNNWQRFLINFRETLLSCDINKFLRTDILGYTMFVSNASYSQSEYIYLKNTPSYISRWKKALKESGIGWPFYSIHCPASSDNLIHQSYHLALFEDKTKIRIDKLNFVFEFGGGFGAMARLIHKLRFSGEYRIFDFPLIIALQRFYLKANKVKTSIPIDNIGISETSELKSIQDILPIKDNSLFIGMWSFSECPVELRELFIEFLKNFKFIYFAFQKSFSGINNQDYFEALQKKLNMFKWEMFPNENISGNFYLLGIRRNVLTEQ